MNLQKLFDDLHLVSSTNGHIFKDGKFFSCIFVDPESTEKERAYRVLEEHFRILAELEAMPNYAPNGLRKMQAPSLIIYPTRNLKRQLKNIAFTRVFSPNTRPE